MKTVLYSHPANNKWIPEEKMADGMLIPDKAKLTAAMG